jgi:ABC-2 type transport system ATP-binding protein
VNPDHVLVLLMAALLFVAWDGFCLWDLARAKEARILPKWVWAIVVLISFPVGGILYLCFGHEWT